MQKRVNSRPDILRIGDMIDACKKIKKFVKNMDYNDFLKDEKTHYAVIRAFEILGEAANKVSKTLKEENTDIPWSNIISMRNLLIHVYHDADLKIVWFTAKEKVAPLELKLEKILQSLPTIT